MRIEMDRPERFGGRALVPAGDFAPLFDQLQRPVDRKAVADGLRALAKWLGSPHRLRLRGTGRQR